jgi:hypothetical protein
VYFEECPFKVVRTNGGDEVLARAANAELEKASSHLNWPTGATPPYESRKKATPYHPYESSIT